MKRFLYFLLAASMLATIGCSGDNTVSSTPTGKDTVSGTLRDPATNEPIANAIIRNGKKSCRTDATGNWTLGGFTETTAVTNSIAPMFIVSITNLPAEYPTQVFRTVGASQSILGPNDLTIGKLNATVRGMVLNTDGSAAVGATVYLTYIPDGHAGTLSLSAIGTAFSTTVPVVTGTDGRFVIEDIETGALVFPTAQSADGQYTTGGILSTIHLPIIDAYTTNLTTLQFAATPDTDQPLQATAPSISTDGGVTFVTGVASGEFPVGNTVIKFPLNKPIAHTAYTDSTLVNNGAWVNVTAKGGNVSFAISYDDNPSTGYITAVNVSFVTHSSAIYQVSLNSGAAYFTTCQAGSFLNTIGVDAGRTGGAVTFATDSGTTPAAIPVISRVAAPATVGPAVPGTDLSFTWTPVTGAVSYNVYGQRVEAGVTFPMVKVVNQTAANNYTLLPLTNLDGPNNDARLAFANGINKITYNVQVIALGSDLVETAAGTSAVATLTDRYSPYVTNVPAHPTAPAAGIPVGTSITGGPMTVVFSEQMDKASVETASNWTPVYTPVLAAGTLSVFTPVITYNQATWTASVTWTWSCPAASPFAIPAATVMTFTGSFKDLSGNNSIMPVAPAVSW